MIFRYGNFVVSQVEVLYILIPLVILLIFFLRRSYIKEDQRLFVSKGRKRLVFFSRLLLFLCLALALADPYLEFREEQSNVTSVRVLIDRSYSTNLYDTQAVEDALKQIEDKGVSVDIEQLDMQDYSAIGNSILNNLGPSQNILLVSDGQNNFGPSLEDVGLFASSINSRIFSVNLEPKEYDARITVEGPGKVVSEVENTFTVVVKEIGQPKSKKVIISVDDVPVYEEYYKEPIELKRTFTSGKHVIKAEIDSEDYFPENNVFYKTVVVYEKPTVAFITKTESPVSKLYSPFYNIEVTNAIPNSLDDYYAVVLNNIPAGQISSAKLEMLENYVSEGNGLFVIGGKESYDYGSYNSSMFSNMLPVNVGKANKKKDITNIVLLLDTGESAKGELVGGISYFDVQKLLATDIISSVSSTNKVAVIEANYFLNTVSGLSEIGPKRSQLTNEIGSLTPRGLSELRFAYKKAHEMLRLSKGSKNIVILTDGKLIPADQELTLKYVSGAYDDAIKTFIIGVGENADEAFLQSVKELGGGEYFRTNEKDRIKLYFGSPDENPPDQQSILVYDSNHFITKELKQLGRIYGFNSVYPKSTARMLLTTSSGDPVLTVWNFGLGRVAALTTDDGSVWVPDLLSQENSKMLIKTLNWLIEDPERKNPVVVEIPELRQGESSLIKVRSRTMPTDESLRFSEVDTGLFRASYYSNESGIKEIMDTPVAVNYKKEYLNLGISDSLPRVLQITGGEMITNDPDQITAKLTTASPVDTLRREDLSWVFVMAAIVIYLVEIFIRRLFDLKVHY